MTGSSYGSVARAVTFIHSYRGNKKNHCSEFRFLVCAFPTPSSDINMLTSQRVGCSACLFVAPTLIGLFEGMFNVDPRHRLSLEQVRDHPWMHE